MERACVGATCSEASSFVVAARLGRGALDSVKQLAVRLGQKDPSR
jgi:hypothetical protein